MNRFILVRPSNRSGPLLIGPTPASVSDSAPTLVNQDDPRTVAPAGRRNTHVPSPLEALTSVELEFILSGGTSRMAVPEITSTSDIIAIGDNLVNARNGRQLNAVAASMHVPPVLRLCDIQAPSAPEAAPSTAADDTLIRLKKQVKACKRELIAIHTCGLCCMPNVNPRSYTCRHVACETCIEGTRQQELGWWSSPGDHLDDARCPFCRQTSERPVVEHLYRERARILVKRFGLEPMERDPGLSFCWTREEFQTRGQPASAGLQSLTVMMGSMYSTGVPSRTTPVLTTRFEVALLNMLTSSTPANASTTERACRLGLGFLIGILKMYTYAAFTILMLISLMQNRDSSRY
ncbi:hypothetical protein EUX98_g7499 [Antrodiella citrinella]|uniref:RING-type domain-containing protein n=1 Tax=Antrodiella citrinella TaxID=2447956 RepID=A0A4S4MNR7_9APHY|nr:hypothetical protein EUX98_g7499 [Antrodiella citrinella]